jgi:preprotein translocase subunit SecA
MFETMMESVSEDFVKYVSHIEVGDNTNAKNDTNALDQSQNVQYSGTDEIASGAISAISSNKPAETLIGNAPAVVEESKSTKQQTVVKSDFDKTGRNDPCPCGSGKKFKQCCGR